jgi:pullulanase/glycogen debranching enzyme
MGAEILQVAQEKKSDARVAWILYPLGATWDGKGVNFALFFEHATRVELYLFDAVDAEQEAHGIPLAEYTE